MILAKKINRLIDKSIRKKVFFGFLLLAIVQNIIVINPVIKYLDKLGFFPLIAILEIITVPITTLIISLFIIEKLKWKWLTKRYFTYGFLLAIAISFVLIGIEAGYEIQIVNKGTRSLGRYIATAFMFPWSFIFAIPVLALLKIYGWHSFSAIGVEISLGLVVIIPIIWGVVLSLIQYILPKKRKRLFKWLIGILVMTMITIGTLLYLRINYLAELQKQDKCRYDLGLLDCRYYESLGGNYFKLKEGIYWYGKNRPVKEADIDTFEVIDFAFAKDRKNAYFNGGVIPVVDFESWKVIESYYSKDNYQVYDRNKVIKSADPDTFKIKDVR